MRHSRGFFAKIGCGLKRFLLANSTVHPTELIHEGIERTKEGSSSLRAGRESNRIRQRWRNQVGQGGVRGKRVSFADTDVTSCEHLHLNSFSWIRDVWKRVSNRLRRKFFFLSKTTKRFFTMTRWLLLILFDTEEKLSRYISYIHHRYISKLYLIRKFGINKSICKTFLSSIKWFTYLYSYL